MRLSQQLEEATFVISEDALLGMLTEDVIHDMRAGDFSPETVIEAFVGILAPYGLTEDDAPLVEEAIDELGESMELDEGFLDWLKGAAKKALSAVGKAALDAAKEGGKQAVSTSAKELQKRIKAKEKKEPPEPPQPKDAPKEPESGEKPPKKSRKPKAKAKAKEPTEPAEPQETPKGEPKAKPKAKKSTKGKKAKAPKAPKEKQSKQKAEPKPKDDDEGEEKSSGDIKQDLKDIAGKALGKIADDPGKAKEVLKKHGKQAVKALAKHGVKKGMKMVFGKWMKTKGGDKGSKKEWTTGNGDIDLAVEWLMSESVIHTLGDNTLVYDFEGETPEWVTEAFDCDGNRYTWRSDERRLLFEQGGDSATFMMAEAKWRERSPLKPGESKTFDETRQLRIGRDGSGYYTAMTATKSKDFKTYKAALAWLRKAAPSAMAMAEY